MESGSNNEICGNCRYFGNNCVEKNRESKVGRCIKFEPVQTTKSVDHFDTGATRTPLDGKLSYLRALSPAVQRRYVQYLAKHRQTADGVREFDNWKKGIPKDRYMDSLYRHMMDACLVYFGYTPSDPSYDLEDLLCAIRFNTDGLLFELIHERDREEPSFREQLEGSLK